MCRSNSEGGRRCPGNSRQTSNATGPVFVAVDEVQALEADPAFVDKMTRAVAEVRALETRDWADGLADALPAGRTDAFGDVLDARGRRLFALREAGYDGPLDGDCYPDTTSEDAETLRGMARRRGETVDW